MENQDEIIEKVPKDQSEEIKANALEFDEETSLVEDPNLMEVEHKPEIVEEESEEIEEVIEEVEEPVMTSSVEVDHTGHMENAAEEEEEEEEETVTNTDIQKPKESSSTEEDSGEIEKKIEEDLEQEKAAQTASYGGVESGFFAGNVNHLTILQQPNSGTILEHKTTGGKEKYDQKEDVFADDLEETFSDPTIPLKIEPVEQHSSITDESIQKAYKTLKEKRILIVQCVDEKVAYDSARRLAFKFGKEAYDLRQLFVGRGERNANLNIDVLVKETIGKGSKTVVVIDVKSPLLFGSIVSVEYSLSEILKGFLKDKEMYMILSISSELWIEDIQKRGSKFHFDQWNIPMIDDFKGSEEKITQIKDSIPAKENLIKIILYTVAFFPALNQEDFEEIVLLLIASINKKQKKIDKIKEDWFAQPDYFLTQCGVVNLYSENHDSEIIDFSDALHRPALKRFFNGAHSFYIRQKFEILLKSGLLFNITTNTQVTNNLIDLILKKLSANTKEYSIEYLHQLTMKIVDPSRFKVDLSWTAKEFWARVNDNQYFQSNSLSILAQLIDEMLSNSKLEDAVKGYLNFYMIHQREVVQRLTEQLRYSPNFDKLYWIGRLLNEGDKNTRDKSYTFLINLSKQFGVRVSDFLEEIKAWLPDPDVPFKNYSNVNIYGLTFIIDFTNSISKKFPISKFGSFPSKYPLFVTFDGESENTRSKVKLLISWLFHPKISKAMVHLTRIESGDKHISHRKVENEISLFRAYIIEVWYAILLWRIEDLEEEESEKLKWIAAEILREICFQTKEPVWNTLKETWESKSKQYIKIADDHLKEISGLKGKNTPHRKRLLESRALIVKSFSIINQLKGAFQEITIRKKLNI